VGEERSLLRDGVVKKGHHLEGSHTSPARPSGKGLELLITTQRTAQNIHTAT